MSDTLRKLVTGSARTVGSLAAEVGVHRVTLHSWMPEKGPAKTPDPAALRRLLDILQASEADRTAVAREVALGEAPDQPTEAA